jgi:hypothetical protein
VRDPGRDRSLARMVVERLCALGLARQEGDFLFPLPAIGRYGSHRVETDGDPAKRIEWNLLMNKHENRLGYTWIEFGRHDQDGVEHYVTLGCGMHARKGTGIPPHARWYFLTPQRVGETFRLMSENRVPLNRERLEAAIGQSSVYLTASAYRSVRCGCSALSKRCSARAAVDPAR